MVLIIIINLINSSGKAGGLACFTYKTSWISTKWRYRGPGTWRVTCSSIHLF